MAQMQMSQELDSNLQKSLRFMEQAKERGADLIFFPEIQMSPFFPQYEKQNADKWLMEEDSPALLALREQCRRLKLYASPNVYLKKQGKPYDASLFIDPAGEVLGISKMVHIAQAKGFYEQDYYTPSEEGFRVYSTPFGKIGVVICFDRHIPTSIRACAKQGAELILIPTANIQGEPLELFEWEIRVQAFQNTVFVAMCNRVGQEGETVFAGQSLVADPNGNLLVKAGERKELIVVDIPVSQAKEVRQSRPWLNF
jgi:predicted amidohydrolase